MLGWGMREEGIFFSNLFYLLFFFLSSFPYLAELPFWSISSLPASAMLGSSAPACCDALSHA